MMVTQGSALVRCYSCMFAKMQGIESNEQELQESIAEHAYVMQHAIQGAEVQACTMGSITRDKQVHKPSHITKVCAPQRRRKH